MPKIVYKDHRFGAKNLAMIVQAERIIEEYLSQGFKLTLRQIYYQFVARDLIPNTERSYKNIGSLINNGRMAGMIDWSAIEDRTRTLRLNNHWTGPQEIVRACADQFQLDKWKDQEHRVEVWIEKDALVGVIDGICRELDAPFFSCRGYVSQSEMWEAAQRFIGYDAEGIILHLGDHDPSGIDMTRDIQDRLDTFNAQVRVERIALTEDQIELYSPPPNPAKVTDSRFESYRALYGDESWELDALEPRVLVDLVRDKAEEYLDSDMFDSVRTEERTHRKDLDSVASRWGDAVKAVGK